MKTINISEETFDLIKDQLKEEEKSDISKQSLAENQSMDCIKCPACGEKSFTKFEVLGNYNMISSYYSVAEQIHCETCDGLFTIKFNGYLRFKSPNTEFNVYKGWDSTVGLGAIMTKDQWDESLWDKLRDKMDWRELEKFTTLTELKSFLKTKVN